MVRPPPVPIDTKELKAYIAEHGIKAARDHFKTSYDRIYRIIGDPGIRRPYLDPAVLRRDLRKFEYNIPLLARYYGKHAATIYDWMRKHGIKPKTPPWSKADDQYLQDHVYEHSIARIAKHLGRTSSSVQNRMHTLGITTKRWLGYVVEDIAQEWGVDRTWVDMARHKHGLPYKKHDFNISYDPEAVWQWLEAGNVLRLEYDRIDKSFFDLRQLHRDAQKIFVSRIELAAMGYYRESATARKLLRIIPHVFLHREHGYYYRRDEIFEHMVAHRWCGNYQATPDQWWYQEIINECARRYVTAAAAKYSIDATYEFSANHRLAPKQVHRGLYDRSEMVRYLSARRNDSARCLERLAEYEEAELRCTTHR